MNQNGHFRSELAGGGLLVGERVPGRRSAAVGVWLRVGSRDEEPGREGLAHFIEHLVFKGTRNRSGREIAASLERVGGSLEAFTTKDTTCFYARVLEDDLDLAVEILGDLVSNPLFAPGDVDVERGVVLDELRNVEDTPEDLVGDLAQRHLWPDDVMGASILGSRDSLAGLDAGRVADFHRRAYRRPRLVVSATGAVDPDRLARLLDRHLELPGGGPTPERAAPRADLSTLALYPSDLSQLYLVLATEAPAETAPGRQASQLLADIVGGGMSSRLFQTIREESGLAYSVQAYTEHFDDVGMFGVSMAVSPKRGTEAVSRTLEEMQRVRREGLRPGELEGAKAQARGGLVMGLESLTNRMSHLARNELRVGGPESLEETLAGYEAVTEADILEVAEALLDPQRQSLVAVGPVSRKSLAYRTFGTVLEAEEA